MSSRNNRVKYKPTCAIHNISCRRSTSNSVSGNRWLGRSCGGFGLLKRSVLSPVTFLKLLRGKVAKASRLGRKHSPSPGVSSSGRSRPLVTPIDTHRTEAIEDCIQFINSSSSLPRSNSVSTNPS